MLVLCYIDQVRVDSFLSDSFASFLILMLVLLRVGKSDNQTSILMLSHTVRQSSVRRWAERARERVRQSWGDHIGGMVRHSGLLGRTALGESAMEDSLRRVLSIVVWSPFSYSRS